MSCVRLIRSGTASSTVAVELEQLNRGGAIRFMGELTPAAQYGSTLAEIERRQSSTLSAILAISEVECYIAPSYPPPRSPFNLQSCHPRHPVNNAKSPKNWRLASTGVSSTTRIAN